MLKTQVLIIGAGVTGTGLARDLALRGVQSIVADQGDINAGASGANHGLLHSGGRYVFSDAQVAQECRREAEILKRVAPQCIEDTGGLFVAVEGDDEKYAADFPRLCDQSRIPVRQLDVKEAREMEPALSDKLIAAYQVEDATVDPFKLSLLNMCQARGHGSVLLRHHKVVAFKLGRGRIQSVRLVDTRSGRERVVEAEQVVNAAGAWAGEIAALAGANLGINYSKGSLLVTHSRITQMVVNRLRKPGDGDILVPGGTVSILGTTSVHLESLDEIRPTVGETDLIVSEGAAMVPVLENTRYVRAYAGVRPLIKASVQAGDRSASRGFLLMDHHEEGLENFATIPGGKLTTYRYMAEKTADLVCSRLGVTRPCRTDTEPLPGDEACSWTEPGRAPRAWIKANDPQDQLLCECEMVSRSVIDRVVDSVREQKGNPDLLAVALRTRMGKGACQGAFCGLRVTAHLYDQQAVTDRQGLYDLKRFFRERWKGQRPVLWNGQLSQAELTEALYCGFLDLELGLHGGKENLR